MGARSGAARDARRAFRVARECYNPSVSGPHEESRPARGRTRLRPLLLAAIAVLYVFSVPWYRAPDAPLRLWFGLPDWVATALCCYAVAAVLNAWAWWSAAIDEPAPEAPPVSTRAPADAGDRP